MIDQGTLAARDQCGDLYLISVDAIVQRLLHALPRDRACHEVGISAFQADEEVEDRDLQ